jgi:hypothetical protein
MGLKHLLLVDIVLFLFSIFIGITLSGEKVNGRLRFALAFGLGQQKMLVDFDVVIGVASISGTWQKKWLLNVFFPIIITKENLGRNVALTSFVGWVAIVVVRK